MPNCKNCGHSISNTKKWEKSPTGYVHSNRSGAGRGIKCSILDQTVAGPLKYLCGCIRPEPFQEDFESAEQAEQQREEEWNQKQKQEQKKWEEEKKGIYINLPEEEGEVITKLESILNAPFRLDYSPFESCGEFSVEDGQSLNVPGRTGVRKETSNSSFRRTTRPDVRECGNHGCAHARACRVRRERSGSFCRDRGSRQILPTPGVAAAALPVADAPH